MALASRRQEVREPPQINKNRLESFYDGVIAIILTIMVLELKVPHEPSWQALGNLWPVYFAYLLSFGNVLLMWISHHEIVAAVRTIDYTMIFANGVTLFFMSLVPFAMAFASETHWTEPVPVALYGVVMLAVCLGFVWFRLAAARHANKPAVRARQHLEAGITTAVCFAFLGGSIAAFYSPRAALFLYAGVPLGRLVYRGIRGD